MPGRLGRVDVSASGTGTLWSIQALRGIAALMVVWHHASTLAPSSSSTTSEWGTAGVDVFFVISGFVMAVSTHARPVGPGSFLLHRFVRVWPLYALLTLAMTALAVVPPHLFSTLAPTARTLALSLCFVPHYSETRPGEIWPLLVPGWTLNDEMFFYVLFAATLAARRYATALLIATCVGLVLVGAVFGPFDDALPRTYTGPLLLEFATGALIAVAWLRGWHVRSPWIAVVLAVVGAVSLVGFPGSIGSWPRQVGAAVVVWATLGHAWQRRISPLAALGDASYSLYLTHVFTIAVVARVVQRAMGAGRADVPAALTIGIALAASVVVGVATYRMLEAPMTRRLRAAVFPRPATPR